MLASLLKACCLSTTANRVPEHHVHCWQRETARCIPPGAAVCWFANEHVQLWYSAFYTPLPAAAAVTFSSSAARLAFSSPR